MKLLWRASASKGGDGRTAHVAVDIAATSLAGVPMPPAQCSKGSAPQAPLQPKAAVPVSAPRAASSLLEALRAHCAMLPPNEASVCVPLHAADYNWRQDTSSDLQLVMLAFVGLIVGNAMLRSLLVNAGPPVSAAEFWQGMYEVRDGGRGALWPWCV